MPRFALSAITQSRPRNTVSSYTPACVYEGRRGQCVGPVWGARGMCAWGDGARRGPGARSGRHHHCGATTSHPLLRGCTASLCDRATGKASMGTSIHTGHSPGCGCSAFHSSPSLKAQVRTIVTPMRCMASRVSTASCRVSPGLAARTYGAVRQWCMHLCVGGADPNSKQGIGWVPRVTLNGRGRSPPCEDLPDQIKPYATELYHKVVAVCASIPNFIALVARRDAL